MKKIILIAGKACAGKDTLVKLLMKELNLPMAVSFTTRPKRTGETQGVEYDFIDEQAFWGLYGHNLLAEYTSYKVASGDTWYYGLTKEELEKDDYVLAIVNPEGVRQIKEIYKDKVHVIYVTADDKTRIKRYLDRDKHNNVAECCRRFLADEKDFKDFKYDCLIINDNIGSAYRKIQRNVRNLMGNITLEETRKEFKENPHKFVGDRSA